MESIANHSGASRATALLYWISSIGYLLSMYVEPYKGQFAFKALPIAILGIWVCTKSPVPNRGWLLAAIGFSACGDVLLALSIENRFVLGLAAFLLAHLAYIRIVVARTSERSFPPLGLMLLAIYLVIMISAVIPNAGNARIPIVIYMLVICTMAAFAMKSKMLMLIVGTLVFMVSDSLIAINEFVVAVPYEALLIMATYYVAQYLMVVSLSHPGKEGKVE